MDGGQRNDKMVEVCYAIVEKVRHQHVLDMETWEQSYGQLSDIHQLEFLYKKQVKTNKEEQARYEDLLHFVMDHLIAKMKLLSPEFNRLFKDIYYTGSFWDGLTVNSTTQEFDLNIVFDWKTCDMEIRGLDSDGKKPNFCYLKPCTQTWVQKNRKAARECIVNASSPQSISPKKMFQLMQSSFDQAVSSINHKVSLEGRTYRVTRKVGAPINVQVRGLDNNMDFDVDLVPSLRLEYTALDPKCSTSYQQNNSSIRKLHQYVSSLCRQFGCSSCPNCGGSMESFMAISLHKADPDKFELDFHDLERKILFNRGCVKKVIKLMKYLRDIKGGPMLKLWSHLIKTSVMHLVVKRPEHYWHNSNLVNCFVDSLSNLLDGLKNDQICDIFFPEWNLLSRIKNVQVKKDSIKWLERALQRYHTNKRVISIFQ